MIHLVVHGMIPPSPNLLRKKFRNFHALARLRDSWENALYYALDAKRRNELKDFAAGHKMRVRFIIHHSQFYDADNATASVKPVLDAMRRCEFIQNDNAEWLDLIQPIEQVKAPRSDLKTEVWIGPVFSNSA